MADINVDVNLPSAINVDITSPTQALAANVSIPGPQGPVGIQGPSGVIGPTGAIGPQGPTGVVNTGQFDLRYYSITNPSGFISGDLALYATTINLVSTGSSLNTSINNLSGLFTGYTGTLDATYATDLNVTAVANNLALTGSVLATNLANTGSTLNTKINNLSGYVNSSSSNIVFTTGNQTINGNKTFLNNIQVSGTGIFNAVDLNNIDALSLSGVDVTLTNSNVNVYGNILISGVPVLTGVNLSSYATITNLANTGSTLDSKIGSLSGTLTSNYATILNLASTGSNLQTQINNLDNVYATDTSVTTVANNLALTGSTLGTNLASTGSTLQTNINNLSNTYATITNVALTGSTLATNIASTGSTLDTKINSLSGSSVLLYGDQSAGGVKTFRDNVYINNLFVTGTQTVVSTNNFSVQSPYLLLNLTGGAVDGGIFFVTGSGLTGINNSGPIIGFDHSNKFKFGISTRNSDLSTLPDIASVQDIQAYSGVADNKFSTITNLASTGSTLEQKISSLSGTLTSNYATITNLASTGSTLNTKINNLSGVSVLTFGDQTISGNKTFINNINVSGSGIFNALDLNNIDNLSLSGVDVTLTDSIINVNRNIFISGNPVLTGLNLTPYATTVNLALTGLNLSNNINSLSGLFTGFTGTLDATYASDIQLANTGSTLDNKINALTGTLTGNYVTKSNGQFTNRPTVNGTGVLLSGEVAALPNTIVYTTGLQNVSGSKTFLNTTIFKQDIILSGAAPISNPNVSLGVEMSNGIYFDNFYKSPYIKYYAGYDNTLEIRNPGGSPGMLKLINGPKPEGNEPEYGQKIILDGDTGEISYEAGNHYFNGGISFSTKPTVNGTGVLLSGEVAALPNTIVYTTGDQSITGVKIFQDNVYLQGDTTIENLNLLTSNYFFDGVTIEIINSSVRVSGDIYVSGNKVLTGVDLSSYATKTNLASTGSTLLSSISSLNSAFTGYTGTLDATYASDTQLATTGSTLVSLINSLSGTSTGDYVKKSNGQFTNRPTVNGTGVLLSGEVAALPNTIVYTTGDQTITGIKTFVDDLNFFGITTIQNLSLLTSEFNFDDVNIEIINSSVRVSGDIYVSGNKVLTGVDLSSYATKTNLASTGSTLDTKINALSGVLTGNYLTTSSASSTYATITNLASTGSTLLSSISSLNSTFTGFTGNLDATYASDTQLASTGSTLNTKINNLSGYINSSDSNIVYTTGDQTISGNKIFKNKIRIGDSEHQNAIFTDSDGTLYISGYQSTLRTLKLIAASNSYNTSITFGPGEDGLVFNSPDYYFVDERPKVVISNPYSIRPLALLDEVVLNTGNQIISGVKTFIGNHIIRGNTTVSGSINISGNYDIYSQIENVKKLAIAYAIAL